MRQNLEIVVWDEANQRRRAAKPNVVRAITALIRKEEKIRAIALVRDLHDVGLREAKMIVDYIEAVVYQLQHGGGI